MSDDEKQNVLNLLGKAHVKLDELGRQLDSMKLHVRASWIVGGVVLAFVVGGVVF